jgi:hypothetical protein
MVKRINSLKGTFRTYEFRRVGKLASEIHDGFTRENLADKIVARCTLGAENNPEVIRKANHALSIMGDLRRV